MNLATVFNRLLCEVICSWSNHFESQKQIILCMNYFFVLFDFCVVKLRKFFILNIILALVWLTVVTAVHLWRIFKTVKFQTLFSRKSYTSLQSIGYQLFLEVRSFLTILLKKEGSSQNNPLKVLVFCTQCLTLLNDHKIEMYFVLFLELKLERMI